jgi:hypothetical protein
LIPCFIVNKIKVEKEIIVPSGMYAAMTASSANIHKQYFTNNGYSALQISERCFPAKIETTNNYIFKQKASQAKKHNSPSSYKSVL